MRISNSKLKTFNRCKLLYIYKFEKNLQHRVPALPLKRGLWLHELLEALYTTGDWKPKWKELKSQYDTFFDEEKEVYGDLPGECRRIMNSYCFHWKDEDKTLNWIAMEEEVEVALPHGHTLVFRFDGIVEDEWGRWLVEHKSHTTIPRDDYRFLDVQAKRYVWGLNKDGRFGEITGILWNYLRTKAPTIPQLKKDGDISKRKIETDYYTYYTSLKKYGLDPRNHRDVLLALKGSNVFFRRERVPAPTKVVERLVKEAVFTADEIAKGVKGIRSIERSCDWCSFKDPCIVSLYGGDEASVLKSKYQVREKGDYYADDINWET